MADVFYDSFDHYASSDCSRKYNSVGATLTIGAFGRNGTNGLRNQSYIQKTVTPGADYYLGLR